MPRYSVERTPDATFVTRATKRSFGAFLVIALLAGCSSPRAGAPVLPQGAESSATGVAKGTLVLRVRMPLQKKTRREPRYISAATKGMTLTFAGPSTFTQTINLTPSDPRCSGSPVLCTIDVVLKAGSYAATVDTYDAAPVSGAIPSGAHLLSTARNVAFNIAKGRANQIGITLDGIPASISVGGLPSDASAGSGFLDASFSVTVKDASGYLIAGTYSTPITLSDSDTSGATAVASSGSDDPPAHELLSSSDIATLSYTGRAIAPATIGASAGTISGHAIFAVRLPVFVAVDGTPTQNGVWEIPPGCVAAGCVVSLGAVSGLFVTGVAVDGSGDVFLADAGDSLVKEIPSGCGAANCVATLGGGFSAPQDVAVDGSGNVFVADAGNNAVKEIPAGCSGTGCILLPGDGAFKNPDAVALDGSGNVFVADTGNNAVKEIPLGCYSANCVNTVRSGFNSPQGVAVDGLDNVFVADTGNSAVKEVLHGCTRGVCVIVLDGKFSFPDGIAIDGSGNVFVGDSGNNLVKEFPAGCLTIACALTLGGGFQAVYGVAVL